MPAPLKGAEIYAVDMGGLVAGTKFRGAVVEAPIYDFKRHARSLETRRVSPRTGATYSRACSRRKAKATS